MSNPIIEAINLACTVEPRDFNEEEKQYILNNKSFRDDLRFWWESTASDCCWTPANFDFIKSLYSNTGENCIDNFASDQEQTIPFVLKDNLCVEGRVEGRIEMWSAGIELFFSGYGVNSTESGYGYPVYVALSDGRLQVWVWSDINQEEATYTITLENARETNLRN